MTVQQAFHIFRKDVRGLRIEIAAVLAVIALFAHFHATASFEMLIERGQIYQLLLPASLWFLIGRVIQTEALWGNRQFWLTRPYSRLSLVLAKLMFLVLFVALPLALSDLAILRGQGFVFSLSHDAAAFACEQLLRIMFFVVPAVALAAVTGTMIEFVLGGLLLVAADFGVYAALASLTSRVPGSASAGWIAAWLGLGLLGVIGGAVIPWQYKMRCTWLSRAVVIAGIVLAAPGDVSPLGMAAAGIAPRLAEYGLNGPGIQISLKSAGQPDAARDDQARCSGAVLLIFPFTIQPLPEGAFAIVRVTDFGIGGFSQPGRGFQYAGAVTQGRVEFSHAVQMYCQEYQALSAASSRPHLSVVILVFHNPRSYNLPGGSQPVEIPEMGLCRRSDAVGWIDCLTPFHDVRVEVVTQYPDPRRGPDMIAAGPSPFPADPSLTPLSWQRFFVQAGLFPGEEASKVTTLEWVGGIGRTLEMDGSRLADYVRIPTVNGVP